MRFLMLFLALIVASVPANAKGLTVAPTVQDKLPDSAPYASFAGGCFWCMESEFRRLDGVLFTRSGYEGGTKENPSYEDVTTGRTGHAEVVEIYYNPEKITYRELADHFLRRAHDPTTLNRQGVDEGTQYRSAIFYHDESQKKDAQEAIVAAEADKAWNNPIVTTLEPHGKFWPAEDYHQQYYEKYEQKTGAPHIRAWYKIKKWAEQEKQDLKNKSSPN
jgi:peptide-methionine (S)-S-oxide reductase